MRPNIDTLFIGLSSYRKASLIICFVVGLCFLQAHLFDKLQPCDHHYESHISVDKHQGGSSGGHEGHGNPDWDELFKFIPVNRHNCNELFVNTSLPHDFQEKFANFKKLEVPGVNDGHSAQKPKEYQMLATIANFSFVKTVCETGFNAGHSSFMWLTANHHAVVYSFDDGSHYWARTMKGYLNMLYPGRLNVIWGDSRKTLPKFRMEHPHVKCDIMFVDGGHTGNVPEHDLTNFRQMANNRNNIVIVDDYPCCCNYYGGEDIGKAWETRKRDAIIAEIYQCCECGNGYKQLHVGYSLGRFVPQDNQLRG